MGRARAVTARATVAALALPLTACGSDDEAAPAPALTGPLNGTAGAMSSPSSTLPDPAALNVPVPAGLDGAQRRLFVAGRDVARERGCLACHRIGADGGNLGTNLNGIGERTSDAAIRRALVDAEAPMPSYRELPGAKLDALVVFLAALERMPGGATCPDDSDCG